MGISFESGEESGLTVVDPIERHRYLLDTPGTISPDPAATEEFHFPVDAAVRMRTAAVTLPNVVLIYVREGSGTEAGAIRAEVADFAFETLPHGTYTIELNATVKLYLRVEAPVQITTDLETGGMNIGFDESTEVVVGARSYHNQPADTITTPDDPADVMRAVSAFGSALKSTNAERSYPTLRGHPPTVECGEELRVPEHLAPPETGVSIEVPPEYGAIYTAAPLAYYLGARLVPGDDPRIRTDAGFEHALDGPQGFDRSVERVLKQTFFLDCLTRTEGVYQIDLHERDAVEDDPGSESESGIDLDFAALYERPLAEQLEAYLDVPFSAVEPHLPAWKLTTHVEPTVANVETLPFLVNDLAIVRTGQAETVPGPEPPQVQRRASSGGGTEGHGTEGRGAEGHSTDGLARSANSATDAASATAADTDPEGSFVQPTATDSLEQAWIGEGTPVGASKTTADAYRNRLARSPNESDIALTVVCNDAEMNAEERDVVDEVYGSREVLPIEVTVRRDLTTADLREVLAAPVDFLHYIGHVDDEGFECGDGKLDARTVDPVGVDAFLLNACESYEQGMALIENGAIGGVVTLVDVLNTFAESMGRTLARLLNRGFPLRVALEISREDSIVGEEYIVVGDGGLAIAQPESVVPNLYAIERDGDSFRVDFRTYPPSHLGMGAVAVPYIDSSTEHYLVSGTAREFTVSPAELERFLDLEVAPVKIDGDLRWSDRISVENL